MLVAFAHQLLTYPFQFQDGSIKWAPTEVAVNWVALFQFQDGSIKCIC